jgi:hypothetical protein
VAGEIPPSKPADKLFAMEEEQPCSPQHHAKSAAPLGPLGSQEKREPSPGTEGEGQGSGEELGSAAAKNPPA